MHWPCVIISEFNSGAKNLLWPCINWRDILTPDLFLGAFDPKRLDSKFYFFLKTRQIPISTSGTNRFFPLNKLIFLNVNFLSCCILQDDEINIFTLDVLLEVYSLNKNKKPCTICSKTTKNQ